MIKKIVDNRNYIILFIIILLIILIIVNKKETQKTKAFNYFNEDIVINLYTNKDTNKVFDQIDKIYKRYNQCYQKSDNNLDCKDLLKYGKNIYKKTNGLVDITSAKLLEAKEEGKEYDFTTTIDKINLNDKKTLKNINTESIIGAFATKKIENYLKKQKINKYIINEDGNIITGKHYNNKKYKVSLMDKGGNLIKIISLENEALAVKGNTQKFKPYMINPKTNEKIKNDNIVAVITDDINKANTYANVLYLMSKEAGMNYVKDKGIKVIWYIDGKIYKN